MHVFTESLTWGCPRQMKQKETEGQRPVFAFLLVLFCLLSFVGGFVGRGCLTVSAARCVCLVHTTQERFLPSWFLALTGSQHPKQWRAAVLWRPPLFPFPYSYTSSLTSRGYYLVRMSLVAVRRCRVHGIVVLASVAGWPTAVNHCCCPTSSREGKCGDGGRVADWRCA